MAAASEDSENVNVKTTVDETTIEVSENNRLFKLADLKVAELKFELEKRNLDKNGVKSVLTERLKSALLEEGEDPEEFNFDILTDTSKTKITPKKKKVSDSETNGEMEGSVENNELLCETKNVPNSEMHKPVNNEFDESLSTKLDNSVDLEVNKSDEVIDNSKIDSDVDKLVTLETDLGAIKSVGLETGQSDLKINELIVKENMAVDLKENKSVNADMNELMHSEVKLAYSEVNNTTNLGGNNSAELEINSSDYLELNNSDDKMNCEVTLQLSIDEEEAQLNEDESVIDIPKSDEIDSKLTEEMIKPSSETTCNAAAPAEVSNQTTPVKSVTEDSKEKKIVKTPVHSKIFESTVSPKVLKVIGKNDKIKNANVLAKSLWVTALPTTTRAADLKTLFSKQGRVLSVKIVKSTKQTPGKCYGFVTMATSTDATKAIQNLHCTELNGRTISVERTQSEPSALLKKSESKLLTGSAKKQLVKKEIVKATEGAKALSSENKAASKMDTKPVGKKITEDAAKKKEEKRKSSEKVKSKEKDSKSKEIKEKEYRRPVRRPPISSRSRPFAFNERPRYGTFGRFFPSKPLPSRSGIGSSGYRSRSGIPLYERIREERIRQRDRFRDRERRDIERRHAVEISRHKYIERKQREEAYRLEREKERLRLEREFLERERAEMLKLEREKQLFERQRLAREREELRRQAELRHSTKRPRVTRESEAFWDERKKSRFEERTTFPVQKLRLAASTSSRYQFPARERSRSIGRREFDRFSSSKAFAPPSRSDFGDRDIRREVSIGTREERRIFERSDIRDRDHRRSLASRERPSSRREAPPRSMDWKHERRVHERPVPPRSSGQRRMTYY